MTPATVNAEAVRTCRRCHVTQPADEFYVTRRDTAGAPVTRKWTCRTCTHDQAARWRTRKQQTATAPVDREHGTLLPIGPFRDWLDRRLTMGEYDLGSLAAALGVSDRRLYAWMHVNQRVHIDVVDRALLTEGSVMLRDLYPELYRWEDAA